MVTLPQRAVAAVGEQQDGRDRQQQPGRAQVRDQRQHRHQGQAGVGHRGQGAGGGDLQQDAPLRGPLVQRDRGHDHQRADQVDGQGGQQRRPPAPRPQRVAAAQQPEDGDGQAGLDQEQRQVEGQLGGRLAAVHRQRGRRSHQAGQHQLRRRQQVQAGDQRQLAEGEGLRVAPELQVDGEHRGRGEARGEHRPGELTGAGAAGRNRTTRP
jgi:hypothetical protein